jgi:Domain of unknown function (DUF397)
VDTDLSRAVWYKSTFSKGSGGDCVEVATNLPDIVALRDSKDREGPNLTISDRSWSAFVQGIKHGDFNLT